MRRLTAPLLTKVILGPEGTSPDEWVGGWISWKYSHLSPGEAGVWSNAFWCLLIRVSDFACDENAVMARTPCLDG